MAKRNARDIEDSCDGEHFQDEVVDCTSAQPRSRDTGDSSTSDGSPLARPSGQSARPEGNATPVDKEPEKGGTIPDKDASTTSPERSSSDPHSWIYHLKANEERRSRRSTAPRSSPPGHPRERPRNSTMNSISVSRAIDTCVETEKDEAMARRLDQELRDAELASRLKSEVPDRSSEKVSAYFSDEATTASTDSSRDSSVESLSRRDVPTALRDKVLYYGLRMISCLLVLGVIFLISITVFGRQVIDHPEPTTWEPGWPDEEPSGAHSAWKTEGRSGLTLQVLNNLEPNSDWREILVQSIEQWNNGSPKAVEVNISEMTYDPECQAERKALKVCNGNYGPTNWRGYNQILLQDEYIVASVAHMNDHYLIGSSRAQKLYTMCHELGHGERVLYLSLFEFKLSEGSFCSFALSRSWSRTQRCEF